MLALIAAAMAGPAEISKFEELYHTYRAQMMHVAFGVLRDHHLAEDAVQEAFLRVARNLGKVGLVDSRETRGFLLTITKNAALSLLKTAPTEGLEEDLAEIPGPQRTEDQVLEQAGFEDLVSEILALDGRCRGALYLQWVEGLSLGEMSRLLGVPVGTVKQRLYRGKKLLRERLRKKGYGGGVK